MTSTPPPPVAPPLERVAHPPRGHSGEDRFDFGPRLEAPPLRGSAVKAAPLASDPALREESRAIVARNAFETDRGLRNYFAMLGGEYVDAITALTARDHMLDSGAGECVAMLDYIRARPPELRASVTALSYEAKTPEALALDDLDRARLIRGRYLEDTTASELIGARGKFKVISDVYGPASYASNPGLIINRYLETLAPGGQIFLFGPDNNRIERPNGTQISFRRWLFTQPGLRVDWSEHTSAISIQPLGDGVRVPELELVSIQRETAPPHLRIYREVAPSVGSSRPSRGGVLDLPSGRGSILFQPDAGQGRKVLIEFLYEDETDVIRVRLGPGGSRMPHVSDGEVDLKTVDGRLILNGTEVEFEPKARPLSDRRASSPEASSGTG